MHLSLLTNTACSRSPSWGAKSYPVPLIELLMFPSWIACCFSCIPKILLAQVVRLAMNIGGGVQAKGGARLEGIRPPERSAWSTSPHFDPAAVSQAERTAVEMQPSVISSLLFSAGSGEINTLSQVKISCWLRCSQSYAPDHIWEEREGGLSSSYLQRSFASTAGLLLLQCTQQAFALSLPLWEQKFILQNPISRLLPENAVWKTACIDLHCGHKWNWVSHVNACIK